MRICLHNGNATGEVVDGLRGLLNHEGHEVKRQKTGVRSQKAERKIKNSHRGHRELREYKFFRHGLTQINTALRVLDLLCYQRKSKMACLL